MTPLQIAMLLHYYAVGIPYAESDKAHQNSEAVARQRLQLIEFELMETDEGSRSGYRVTERGVAYVKALCEMPFPIKKWVMPNARAEQSDVRRNRQRYGDCPGKEVQGFQKDH